MPSPLALELGKKVKKEKDMEEDEEYEEEDGESMGDGKDAAVCISLAIHIPYGSGRKRSTEADRNTGNAHRGASRRVRNDARRK